MSRPVIVVGDRTSHGGVVITGSPFSDVDGKAIARIGDKVTCPKKGHGSVTTIVTGDVTDIIDGGPVARHGDKTACGATLISSQMLTYTDDGSDSCGNSAAGAVSSPLAQSLASAPEHEGRDHDQHLILEDQDGQPLEGIPYRLTDVRNAIIDGTTGADGKTKVVAGNRGETLDCDIAKATRA